MNLKTLPDNVRSRIRTGIIINSVRNCVQELVENSLDSKATHIAIRINLITFKLQVLDNGDGITKEQLELVGIRYMTSKCCSTKDLEKNTKYGYRGEALSSIKDCCSKLIIVSKCNEHQTYCKIFENGESGSLQMTVHNRVSNGTTVIVNNLFGKSRIQQANITATLSLEFENIKQYIKTSALIHPKVIFVLRDDARNVELLRTKRADSSRSMFVELFPTAINDPLSLGEFSSRVGRIKMVALISKEVCQNSRLQFLFVNKRFIAKNSIYRILNESVAKSFYLKGINKSGNCQNDEIFPSGNNNKNKYAIFVISIRCPYSEYDITFHPTKCVVEFKNFNDVKKCIEKISDKYLSQELLLSNDDKQHKKYADDIIQELIDLYSESTGKHVDFNNKDVENSNSKITHPKTSKNLSPVKRNEFNERNTIYGLSVNRMKHIYSEKQPELIDLTEISAVTENFENKIPGVDKSKKKKSTNYFKENPKYRDDSSDDDDNNTDEVKNKKRRKKFSRQKILKNSSIVKKPLDLRSYNFRNRLKEKSDPTEKRINLPFRISKKDHTTNIKCTDYFSLYKADENGKLHLKTKNTRPLFTGFETSILNRSNFDTNENNASTNFNKNVINRKNYMKKLSRSGKSINKRNKNNFEEKSRRAKFQDSDSRNLSDTSESLESGNRNFIDNYDITPDSYNLELSDSSDDNLEKSGYAYEGDDNLKKSGYAHEGLAINWNIKEKHTSIEKKSDKFHNNKQLENKDNFSKSCFENTEKICSEFSVFNKKSLSQPSKLVKSKTDSSNLDLEISEKFNSELQRKFMRSNRFLNSAESGILNLSGKSDSEISDCTIPDKKCDRSRSISKNVSCPKNISGLDKMDVNDENVETIDSQLTKNKNLVISFNNENFLKNLIENFSCNLNSELNPDNIMSQCNLLFLLNLFNKSCNNVSFGKISDDVNKNISKDSNRINDECVENISDQPKQLKNSELEKDSVIRDKLDDKNRLVINDLCATKSSNLSEFENGGVRLEFSKFLPQPAAEVADCKSEYFNNNCTPKILNKYQNVSKIRNGISKREDINFDEKTENFEIFKITENCPENKTPASEFENKKIVKIGSITKNNEKQHDAYDRNINSNFEINEELNSEQLIARNTNSEFVFDPRYSDGSCPNKNRKISKNLDSFSYENFLGVHNVTDNERDGQIFKLYEQRINSQEFTLNFAASDENVGTPINLRKNTNKNFTPRPNSKNPDKNLTPLLNSKNTPLTFSQIFKTKDSNTDIEENQKSFKFDFVNPQFQKTEKRNFFPKFSPTNESRLKISPSFTFSPVIQRADNFFNLNKINRSRCDVNLERTSEGASSIFCQNSLSANNSPFLKHQNRNYQKNEKNTPIGNFEILNNNKDEYENSSPKYFSNKIYSSKNLSAENKQTKFVDDRPENSFTEINYEKADSDDGSNNHERLNVNLETEFRQEKYADTTNSNRNKEVNKSETAESNVDIYVEKIDKGITVKTQERSGKKSFRLSVKNSYMPKGMFPAVYKFKQKVPVSLTNLEKDSLHEIVSNFDNNTFQKVANKSENISSRIMESLGKFWNDPSLKIQNFDRVYRDINDCLKLTKNDISNIEFLDQIDKKFLAAIMNTSSSYLLVILDQHAVHERIRVERLLKEYKDAEDNWRMISVNPPFNLNLVSSDVHIMYEYRDRFLKLGISFQANVESDSATNDQTVSILIDNIPLCIYNRCVRENIENDSIVKEFMKPLILELIEQIKCSRGVVASIPNTLQDIINYEACKGAIKFGNKLSRHVCISLLKDLQRCKIPFQCAHGRPLLIPLIDLLHLQQFHCTQTSIPDLSVLKKKLNYG